MPVDYAVSMIDGLSKRDRFAIAALAGLAGLVASSLSNWSAEAIAREAYEIADAMMVERKTERPAKAST